jgi:hypothetical protein
MVEIHVRNNKILILKYFSCYTLSIESRGIVDVVEGNGWKICKTFV